MKIETKTNGNILIDCLQCGKMYEVEDFRKEEYAASLEKFYEKNRICSKCESIRAAQKKKEQEDRNNMEMLNRLPLLLQESGIEYYYCHDKQTGRLFAEPPVKYSAEFFSTNANWNILLSGPTGSGKTTSACFIAASLICNNWKVKYITLRRLLADWKDAKKSDKEYAADLMLRELYKNDLVIIDEMVGKSKVSDSGQELLFEILEAVNSGACHARIWMLGNFYTGSIEDIFGDPEPVRRRLQENFICARLDKPKNAVTMLNVWKESAND